MGFLICLLCETFLFDVSLPLEQHRATACWFIKPLTVVITIQLVALGSGQEWLVDLGNMFGFPSFLTRFRTMWAI